MHDFIIFMLHSSLCSIFESMLRLVISINNTRTMVEGSKLTVLSAEV